MKQLHVTEGTAQRMNELARMTPAEREAELIREIFGPLFQEPPEAEAAAFRPDMGEAT